jgi:hypothetical protein
MPELDNDLEYCLHYNPQYGFSADDIQSVLAVWEGMNDEANWRWVLELNSGKFAFLMGRCCYTGWDCQSWAISYLEDTAQAAVAYEEEVHILQSLMQQCSNGRNETWRDSMNKEFGL